jgi:ElaB/YqjD/DUF883 family membrane-anchored ribosome-binding protein
MKEGAMALRDAAYEKGAEMLEGAAERADTFVQSRPYETALVAFCFGAVCGTFLGMFLAREK